MNRFGLLLLITLTAGFLFAGERVVEYENEYSDVELEAFRTEADKPAIVLQFTGTDGLHYYADKQTAPGGKALSIEVDAPEGCKAAEPLLPASEKYFDKNLNIETDVYSGDFDIIMKLNCPDKAGGEVSFRLSGLACTDEICSPFNKEVSLKLNTDDLSGYPLLSEAEIETKQPAQAESEQPASAESASEASFMTFTGYLLLAIVAGLSFNIMPCVWPVLPLAVQRLVSFSAGSRKTLLLHGAAFSAGIELFFVIFAVISVILKLTTGAALDWSQHLRYPPVIIGMGVLLVVLAMFMFDIFTVGIPSSIAAKSGGNGTFKGSVAMGFLAAVLSTPCSGAILAAVLVWAQTQTLAVSTIAILLLGVGMMLPYLILANSPKLLKKLPKPGNWMEIIRKSMGFLLLLIALKLLLALPEDYLAGAFYYALIAAFAVWMWGSWVNMSTPKVKKRVIRVLAVIILIIASPLLQQDTSPLKWQDYSKSKVNTLVENNQPVLITFTAKWCTNCHYLEKKVFFDEEVVQSLADKSVTPIKADTTSFDAPATRDLKEVYNEPGNVPVTIVITPAGERIKLRGIFDSEELLEIMNEF